MPYHLQKMCFVRSIDSRIDWLCSVWGQLMARERVVKTLEVHTQYALVY